MPRAATAIHRQQCRCRACQPEAHDDRPLIGWRLVALAAVSGAAAMLFDTCGCTPWLAGLLGLLR